MKLSVAKNKLMTAIHGDNISEEIRQRLKSEYESKGATIAIDLTCIPREVLDNLLKENLSQNQSRTIGIFLCGGKNDDAVFSIAVSNPAEFHSVIQRIADYKTPSVEMLINGRWYPVIINSSMVQLYQGEKYCSLGARYMIADWFNSCSFNITAEDFTDDDDKKVEKTVSELLLSCGFRKIESNISDHYEMVKRSATLRKKCGRPMAVTGTVLMAENRRWFTGTDIVELGTISNPGFVVIEDDMESHNNGSSNQDPWSLPFVRVFSLEKKRYCYADVRDIQDRVWDEDAINKLTLTEDLSRILKLVFDVPTEKLFGDVVAGKSGGMIILAEGGPGVGKTMTAEVFSEHTKRPLYVLEMAELGTSLDSVEDNLRKIFRRAARWNAVLLFDEADVFMSKRDDNLERSAIVGVFLRLLDYYKGMFFMTSNRSDVIDPAFRSRITLRLKYEPLDQLRRSKVWDTMFKAAGLTLSLTPDKEYSARFDSVGFNKINHDAANRFFVTPISEVDLNGRQIRNVVRLIKMMYNNSVTVDQVLEVCKYACT